MFRHLHHRHSYLIILLLLLVIPGAALRATILEQTTPTYYSVKGFCVNPVGSGYGSDGPDPADDPDIAYHAGFIELQVPVGAIQTSANGDEYLFIDLSTDRSYFGGSVANADLGNDQYAAYRNGIVFSGTMAADAKGFYLPRNVTITAITANGLVTDPTDVITVDCYVYADGAQINAACKVALPEGLMAHASATFAPGTYTATAGQTLGIYIDVVGDTPTPDSTVRDVFIDVEFATVE
jgi:hypothetical protein